MPTELAEAPKVKPAHVAERNRHTVLIIDDDDTLSEVLSYRLKQQGFATQAAYSGGAGLTKAKAEPPAAIILDLALPDADGLAICEQLSDTPELVPCRFSFSAARSSRALCVAVGLPDVTTSSESPTIPTPCWCCCRHAIGD